MTVGDATDEGCWVGASFWFFSDGIEVGLNSGLIEGSLVFVFVGEFVRSAALGIDEGARSTALGRGVFGLNSVGTNDFKGEIVGESVKSLLVDGASEGVPEAFEVLGAFVLFVNMGPCVGNSVLIVGLVEE